MKIFKNIFGKKQQIPEVPTQTKINRPVEYNKGHAVAVMVIPQYIRQLTDSYSLLNSTDNPETFGSRLEFSINRLKELKEYNNKGWWNAQQPYEYYEQLFTGENLKKLLQNCYNRYVNKARLELKTESAVQKRIEKFTATIQKHIPM